VNSFLPKYEGVHVTGATPALIYWGLWFFYLWDIRQNERVPKEKERAWWWTIFLGGPFTEPVYFWRFIWGGGPGI